MIVLNQDIMGNMVERIFRFKESEDLTKPSELPMHYSLFNGMILRPYLFFLFWRATHLWSGYYFMGRMGKHCLAQTICQI